MEVGDWVVVLESKFTPGYVGKLGKIKMKTGDGERYLVDFDSYSGPLCWFHRTQIEPYLSELEGLK